MSHLVDLLQRFNRKERYWVIRNALGAEGQPAPLSAEFRATLSKTIGRGVPGDAWWGMDYHLNWLIAVALIMQDGTRRQGDNMLSDGKYLIEGNQEDVDLVVAFDRCIIVLEAKCTGSWSDKQNGSKTERLEQLRKELPKDVELFIVYWAPEKRNNSPKLAEGDLKMRLWMDREDSAFWRINRDSQAGRNWIIRGD